MTYSFIVCRAPEIHDADCEVEDGRHPDCYCLGGIPPEAIKADPSTCRHVVMDEMVGARWGFEDCLTCGKRFPLREDINDGWSEP